MKHLKEESSCEHLAQSIKNILGILTNDEKLDEKYHLYKHEYLIESNPLVCLYYLVYNMMDKVQSQNGVCFYLESIMENKTTLIVSILKSNFKRLEINYLYKLLLKYCDVENKTEELAGIFTQLTKVLYRIILSIDKALENTEYVYIEDSLIVDEDLEILYKLITDNKYLILNNLYEALKDLCIYNELEYTSYQNLKIDYNEVRKEHSQNAKQISNLISKYFSTIPEDSYKESIINLFKNYSYDSINAANEIFDIDMKYVNNEKSDLNINHELIKLYTLFSNYYGQVCNGGHQQYYDNGYMGDRAGFGNSTDNISHHLKLRELLENLELLLKSFQNENIPDFNEEYKLIPILETINDEIINTLRIRKRKAECEYCEGGFSYDEENDEDTLCMYCNGTKSNNKIEFYLHSITGDLKSLDSKLYSVTKGLTTVSGKQIQDGDAISTCISKIIWFYYFINPEVIVNETLKESLDIQKYVDYVKGILFKKQTEIYQMFKFIDELDNKIKISPSGDISELIRKINTHINSIQENSHIFL